MHYSPLQANPDASSCTALLTALQEGGQQQAALDVVDFVARSGAAPEVSVLRALVAFCETIGEWPKAVELVQVCGHLHGVSYHWSLIWYHLCSERQEYIM